MVLEDSSDEETPQPQGAVETALYDDLRGYIDRANRRDRKRPEVGHIGPQRRFNSRDVAGVASDHQRACLCEEVACGECVEELLELGAARVIAPQHRQ